MHGLGERVNEDEINRIVRDCDLNNDNQIDFEEFVVAVTGNYGNNHYKKREVEYKLRKDY